MKKGTKPYYRYYLLNRIKSIMKDGKGKSIHRKFFVMDANNLTVYRMKNL